MSTIAEKHEYINKENKKFNIDIIYDENAESPREWDNLGKMICFHSRYNLPNEQDLTNFKTDNFNSWEEMKKELIKEYDPCLILPVFMYDHSGLSLNTGGFSCQWDSGQIGFILATKKQVMEEWKVKRISKKLKSLVESNLKGEVETYSNYLNGDVYGFEITDENDEFLDSCYGFYEIEDAKKEAECFC